MSHELSSATTLVLDLLTYIEQAKVRKAEPAFSIADDGLFVCHERQFRGLAELQFNFQSEEDDIWLQIPRLKEIAPPEPDPELAPWIALDKNPDKKPHLRAQAVIGKGVDASVPPMLEGRAEKQDLFDWYLTNQWEPWAATERTRRRTMDLYKQLFALQQTISSDGSQTPLELVWGIGWAVWRKDGSPRTLEYPLIVQPCEISLNDQTFALEVRPLDLEPQLKRDCFAKMALPGLARLEASWRQCLADNDNRINPFEPSTYEGVLKAAVSHLDPSGSYDEQPAMDGAPLADEKLKITNSWVLFGRERPEDLFLNDIGRLKVGVEQTERLPSAICSFVEVGASDVRVAPEQAFRGLSSSDDRKDAMELYFPMPYNDEQVSIVRKLHANSGVVVQGPPGTGKTHTIANVICHYLALGKRVLVTAKSESALAVLQEKLPLQVRPLSVSLLSLERDGMQQFEHAIGTIADRVESINPARLRADIVAAEEKLDRLHAKISDIDRTVADLAAHHMRSDYSFLGRTMAPWDMAKIILQQTELHQWFDDEPPPARNGVLPFDDSDINALRRSRMAVGKDLAYLGCTLASPDSFPPWPQLLDLHRALVKARAIEASLQQSGAVALIDDRAQTLEKAQALVQFLDKRFTLRAKLIAANQPWIQDLSNLLWDLNPDDPRIVAIQDVGADICELERQRRELSTHAIELAVDAEVNPEVVRAIDRSASGKSAFGIKPFVNAQARMIFQAITVAATHPQSPLEWSLVKQEAAWRLLARAILSKWNALSRELRLPAADPAVEEGFRRVAQWQSHVDKAIDLSFNYDAKRHGRIQEVIGKAGADPMWDGDETFRETFVEHVRTSLVAHIDKRHLAYAQNTLEALLRKLDESAGPVVDDMRAFLMNSIGNPTADESQLEPAWAALFSRWRHLAALLPHLDEIARITGLIDGAGAKKWAARLAREPASADLDTATPANWREAWDWRQAVMLLERIDGRQILHQHFKDRKQLASDLARTYQDLVAQKAWLGVFNNTPDAVKQALAAYLNAVKGMGSGQGKRAIRHRKSAREAMTRAYRAVPCWVLPHWRVSESIPSEIGLFDLVVVDEASQSDIGALPALLRGEKLLVVGDDKQVSPAAVGVAEEHITALVSRFLANQPFGAEMTPDKSIYDLARVVFAGNAVMLKEHFRSVPAIIEFSNREFYKGDIKPLRIAKANERLDPPLVDVFVKGGFRRGDVNPPEAKAIVQEIEAILNDSSFQGRTIGVVTLLGRDQAEYIQKLIGERISPEEIVARKIAVGAPPVFQGRERDIMMVSMALEPGDKAQQNRLVIQQHFNVALSRARDRMYLFRSVNDGEFAQESLNARVMRHFRQPFQHEAKKVQSLRELCESDFEREMFDELVKRGFRVQPQVRSGGYSIDFVVEGSEGRRLAIECDGDQYHGPDRWHDDMARQRVLERAGWTFWRSFASSFVLQRQAVLDDLLQTLVSLGIEPLGADSIDSSVWVQYKEVDPMTVEAVEEVEAVDPDPQDDSQDDSQVVAP